MSKLISKIYRKLAILICMPVFLGDYFDKKTGKDYGVGLRKKITLAVKMFYNNKKITSGTYVLEHLRMAATILNIPKSVKGAVVECGSYKGASATNLSLVCSLCDRQLEIFDSFEGLPEIAKEDEEHTIINTQQIYKFSEGRGKGDWRGSLEEVKDNILRHGNIKICSFNKGFFKDTLPLFKNKVVFVFLDVDLRKSIEDCLKNLWPLLQDRCFIYTHEAEHMEIASLFFDKDWWNNNLNSTPPGLAGTGSGLIFTATKGVYFNNSLGYTIKKPELVEFKW